MSLHPAQFSDELIDPICGLLPPGPGTLFDPMAGLGFKLADIAHRLGREPFGCEIEPGFVRAAHHRVIHMDVCELPVALPQLRFDAVVTSPPFANGMSDAFTSKEGSHRITYIHRLRQHYGSGYQLDPRNMAGFSPRRSYGALMNFMDALTEVWMAVTKMLLVGGVFVVNTKNSVIKGEMFDFTLAVQRQLAGLGLVLTDEITVPVPSMRYGANHSARAEHETLSRFIRPRK